MQRPYNIDEILLIISINLSQIYHIKHCADERKNKLTG